MNIKKFIKNVSPFNNRQEMPTALYIIKKLLVFLLIYLSFVFIGEGLIVGITSLMGYDPLHGVMPEGNIMMLIQYYGFALFFVLTLLYCKLIEKRKISSLGINKRVYDGFTGAVIAVLLLAVIVGVCCLTGVMSFGGFTSGADYLYLLFCF